MTALPTTHDLVVTARSIVDAWTELDDDSLALAISDFGDTSEAKIEAIRAVAGDATARWRQLSERAAAFQALADRQKDIADRCKDRALELLTARRELGLPVKLPGVVRLQANGGKVAVVVHDARQVPAAFLIAREPVVNTDAVRVALEAGQEVPGATLAARGEHARWE